MKTNIGILLGLAFGVYVCYALVMMNDQIRSAWTLLHAAIFSALILCAVGLWKSKAWALRLSLILALAALGFGFYLAHFVWTFWIFEKPTTLERIRSILHPRVSIFLVFPVIWVLYSLWALRNKKAEKV